MSIELIKDVLRIEELRGKEDTQALVETEIYLNPSKPDIEKILWTDGLVEILTTKIIPDRLIVSGVVKLKVIYKTGEEEDIHIVDANIDFKEEIEILGITEEMSASIKSNIEYIEEEVLEDRKISLRSLISIEAKVEEVNTIEVIKDIEEKGSLEILQETIKYKEIYGRETSYAIVKEEFPINEEESQIEQILKLSIKAYEEESKVVEDRIIISGNVMVDIIYYGQGKISTMEKEIPFNHFLEIPGALPEASSELTFEVVEGRYEIQENDEGELSVLDIETKLRISGIAYTENEKDLVVDAYSTKQKINIETEEINLVENIEDIVHKENIVKEILKDDIGEIYSLEAHPTIIDSRFQDEELVVEGILGIQMIYLEKDTNEINRFNDEISYKFYLPMEGIRMDLEIDLDVSLDSIQTTQNTDEIIIKASIKHRININRNRWLNIINTIEETEEVIDKKNRPSITIYIIQKEDTLWDIAKRYNTTLEEIQSGNENINPNNIIPGEKIIIEKKVEVDF